jgi:hypothetical protein
MHNGFRVCLQQFTPVEERCYCTDMTNFPTVRLQMKGIIV